MVLVAITVMPLFIKSLCFTLPTFWENLWILSKMVSFFHVSAPQVVSWTVWTINCWQKKKKSGKSPNHKCTSISGLISSIYVAFPYKIDIITFGSLNVMLCMWCAYATHSNHAIKWGKLFKVTNQLKWDRKKTIEWHPKNKSCKIKIDYAATQKRCAFHHRRNQTYNGHEMNSKL